MLETHELDCIADIAKVVAGCDVARNGQDDRLGVLQRVCPEVSVRVPAA
jgi:hypothetical protein